MSAARVHVGADAEIRARLEALAPGARVAGALGASGTAAAPGAADAASAADATDALLARIVWSRLVEPADAVAAALISALGPGPALDLVASGVGARGLVDTARTVTGEDPDLDARRLAAGLKRWLPRLDRAATLADLERAVEIGMRIITPGDPAWPTALADLGDHAPLLLWVRGDPAHLSAESLAVVGARACTGYGSHVTGEFTDAACAAGAAIVSGAAYGIDAVAHRTALAAGSPTVAVVAGGADRPYPAAHQQLLRRIADAGAVCSEMVPGSAPTRWRFLMRNRVIAALARATLVTEAGARSGSINTAGNAAELGRPLGAVPGPVTSAASSGCHRLVRDYGAALITSGGDVRELLGLADPVDGGKDSAVGARGSADAGGERPTPLHRRVTDALPLRGARPDAEVARLAGVSPEEARGALAELELLGRVERRETPDGQDAGWALLRRE